MNCQVSDANIFHRLADVLSEAHGEAYFEKVAAALGALLAVDHLIIARIDKHQQATTLAMWSKGSLLNNVTFSLKDVPPSATNNTINLNIHPSTAQHFPHNLLLPTLSVDDYLSVPFTLPSAAHSERGSIGFVAAANASPSAIEDSHYSAEVLRMASVSIGAEITRLEKKRRQQQRTLYKRQALKLLSHSHKVITQASSEQALLDTVCQQAVEIGGFSMAWIGYSQPGNRHVISPQAAAGKAHDHVATIVAAFGEFYAASPHLEHTEVGCCTPIQLADIANHPAFSSQKDIALACHLRSVVCLPLECHDQCYGVLALYKPDTQPFDDDELQLLNALAGNVAFGIDTLRSKAAQQRIQRAVLKITLAVSARTGEEFLDQLTHHMADALSADLAFIARLNTSDPNRADTLAVVIDGERQPNFTYTLPGSPCAEVLANSECIVADGAGSSLPVEGRDALYWVRAYAGRRLDNNEGKAIGLLGVMYREPLHDTELVSSVLQIFASGVAAELARQKDEAHIRQLAFYDPGTGLPNRTAFMRRLESGFDHAVEQDHGLGLMLLDLNHFKEINDTQGHDVGDKVLKAVAAAFQRSLTGNEYLARLGGDEFVVLIEPSTQRSLIHTAECLLHALADPLVIDGQSFELEVSIGVALYPDDAESARELLKHADIAMYQAKQQKLPYLFFEAQMGVALASRLDMAKRLSEALVNGSLSLHYQPQIDFKTGLLTGAEALCRWYDPVLGFVGPNEFIPLAEERGLIIPLGNWVINDVFRQLAAWQSEGLTMPGKIAINIASRHFEDPRLIDNLQRKCIAHGVLPSQICLELTESGFMEAPEEAVAITQALKEAGYGLAIDDFGTGYSSLAYLKRFSADKLKIDMSFILDMLNNHHDRTIVETIIVMAHSLGMVTVAEGVESCELATALREMGCQEGQGYLYDKPLPADEFMAKWLKSH
ncbi:EAL domain-containing protein [Halomonas sp. M1]|uniref:bifunctional diguanylate cyclase/phosphodiesterase n=1 Tax=Halomonas sp. M1 TaxID=3035470 RepID=UPI002485C725|nr:EAL domain-containing protein [Halomonas sp. M1]WFE71118.1 EAL domain-containing protein [Halomonas sp. M1]